MRNKLAVGQILYYEGGTWELESIDPDPSWYRKLRNAITNTSNGSVVTFRNVRNPDRRISFTKNHAALDQLYYPKPKHSQVYIKKKRK